MSFNIIDMGAWKRSKTFEHFTREIPCTYSMTVSLDVTAVRQSGQKLYPVLLHSLTAVVNRHPEFRTALNSRGELGVYSEMIPSYTVFHPAVLRMIRLVTQNAHKNGIWVGICGELGADLTLTETFLAIGVDELSVSPRAVLPLRNAIRMTDTRETGPRILAALSDEYTNN